MELPTSVLAGLSLAGDSAHIPEKDFGTLLTKACEGVLHRELRNSIAGTINTTALSEGGLSTHSQEHDDEVFKGVDKGTLKEAYAGLVSLVIEAAKQDADPSNISSLLEDCKFTQDRIDIVNKIYQTRKPYLQILLGSIGSNPPHIVDVNWRLDYYIKSNHLDKVNEPVYLISLKTQVAGKLETEDMQFACSMEQLQDLVGKLKDAVKSVERVGQM